MELAAQSYAREDNDIFSSFCDLGLVTSSLYVTPLLHSHAAGERIFVVQEICTQGPESHCGTCSVGDTASH